MYIPLKNWCRSPGNGNYWLKVVISRFLLYETRMYRSSMYNFFIQQKSGNYTVQPVIVVPRLSTSVFQWNCPYNSYLRHKAVGRKYFAEWRIKFFMLAMGTETKRNVNSRGESTEKLTFLLSVLLASIKTLFSLYSTPGLIFENFNF